MAKAADGCCRLDAASSSCRLTAASTVGVRLQVPDEHGDGADEDERVAHAVLWLHRDAQPRRVQVDVRTTGIGSAENRRPLPTAAAARLTAPTLALQPAERPWHPLRRYNTKWRESYAATLLGAIAVPNEPLSAKLSDYEQVTARLEMETTSATAACRRRPASTRTVA